MHGDLGTMVYSGIQVVYTEERLFVPGSKIVKMGEIT